MNKLKYFIGTVSHAYGEQYGDSGGSQNYCYHKMGFVEDFTTQKRYSISNMCRRELPYHCKEGLTRKVYFNLGQKVLFRLEESENNYARIAHKCGIKWNYENNVYAVVIGVIDVYNNLIIPVEDKYFPPNYGGIVGVLYTKYTKIKLEKWLQQPNEDFLIFYGDG